MASGRKPGSAAEGDNLSLRQYVVLKFLAQERGKGSTSDVRELFRQSAGYSTLPATQILACVRNMEKFGWVESKKEVRTSVSNSEVEMNVWKVTPKGKDVLEKAKAFVQQVAVTAKGGK